LFSDDREPNGAKTESAGFHELKWHGDTPPVLVVIRDGKLERLKQHELPNIDAESAILMMAKSLEQNGRSFVASSCQFLMTSRQVSVRGEAKTFTFDGETQLAMMTDAHIRTEIAVVGTDLTDFSSVEAKTVTLDCKRFRIVANNATATIDFTPRE